MRARASHLTVTPVFFWAGRSSFGPGPEADGADLLYQADIKVRRRRRPPAPAARFGILLGDSRERE